MRVLRSARAWAHVDRGRAWARVVWAAVLGLTLVLVGVIVLLVLSA